MNSDLFPTFLLILDYWIQAILLIIVLHEEPLDHLIVEEVLLLHAENFESLFFGHEFATDSEALYGDLPAAIPLEFVLTPSDLFLPKVAYFL